MTINVVFCWCTINQKSLKLSGTGACVATNLCLAKSWQNIKKIKKSRNNSVNNKNKKEKHNKRNKKSVNNYLHITQMVGVDIVRCSAFQLNSCTSHCMVKNVSWKSWHETKERIRQAGELYVGEYQGSDFCLPVCRFQPTLDTGGWTETTSFPNPARTPGWHTHDEHSEFKTARHGTQSNRKRKKKKHLVEFEVVSYDVILLVCSLGKPQRTIVTSLRKEEGLLHVRPGATEAHRKLCIQDSKRAGLGSKILD